jgi:hypothetical protein
MRELRRRHGRGRVEWRSVRNQTCKDRAHCREACTLQGGMRIAGRHAHCREACALQGGMHIAGRHAHCREACTLQGGMHIAGRHAHCREAWAAQAYRTAWTHLLHAVHSDIRRVGTPKHLGLRREVLVHLDRQVGVQLIVWHRVFVRAAEIEGHALPDGVHASVCPACVTPPALGQLAVPKAAVIAVSLRIHDCARFDQRAFKILFDGRHVVMLLQAVIAGADVPEEHSSHGRLERSALLTSMCMRTAVAPVLTRRLVFDWHVGLRVCFAHAPLRRAFLLMIHVVAVAIAVAVARGGVLGLGMLKCLGLRVAHFAQVVVTVVDVTVREHGVWRRV